MRLVRVSTSTPMSRRIGGRASSLVALAMAGALGLSLPAQAGFPSNVLMTVPTATVPTGGRVVSGSATIATTASGTGSLMTINQGSQQAIIDWDTFSIGAGSHVRFIQPGATAEALNRIFDANPSIILGKLTANGRIYLVNSNGILFGPGAQVDARGLLASSLALSTKVFEEGVFNSRTTPALEGTLKLDANGIAIVDTATTPTGSVENQGTIRSVDPDTGASAGGYVIMVAPSVSNKGLIVADNGQVILAAGARAWLAPNLIGTELDITMRGIVAEIQAGADQAVDVSSLVENLGTLRADRGNVSMIGLTVNQSGRISAGTAVNQNGSIWLLAREKQGLAGQRFGELTLGTASVTETPLIVDGTTLAESQSYEDYRARVKLDGETVALRGTIVSHGGIVEIGQSSNTAGAALTTRRVLLDSTAAIDVSGSTADLSMEKNFLTFKVTSDDLKDAPNQKNGFLLGKEVTVDTRKGNPELFDISAAAANVRRGILEKAATGGDVKIAATEFVAKQGSTIDVSGGAWRYAGAGKATTQLSSGNRVIDIHAASADGVYDGIVDSTPTVESKKWGVSRTYESTILGGGAAVATARYSEGKAAGSLTVDAVSSVLAGVRTDVTVGANQRSAATAPAGARLVLGDATALSADAVSPKFRLGDVSFGKQAGAVGADFDIKDELPAAQAGKTVLSDGIFGSGGATAGGEYKRSGFASVEVYSGGKAEVAQGAAIDAPAGSSLKVYAHEVAVNGDIRLPSGTVSLNARNTFGSTGEANVTLAAGRTISTAGQWVNDSPSAPGPVNAPLYLDGGKIDISGHNVDLGAGSLLDVSAGARLTSSYKLTAGKAGSISLSASPGGPAAQLTDFGRLSLGGSLSGYGINGGAGGSLTLKAASATIGGTARNDRDLVLAPAFFRQGGFTNYNITGHFDTEVAAGTTVRPVAETRVIDVAAGRTRATGANPGNFAAATLLPVQNRKATSLSLTSAFKPSTAGESVPAEVGAPGGVRVGVGALVETDPGATIALTSNSRLDVDGTLSAPGGTIKLSLKTESSAYGGETLRIGSQGRLLAQGVFVPQLNPEGWAIGKLMRGGTVQFDVKKNDLVIEQGAVVDVSGATADMDIPAAGPALYTRQTVGSEGGSIEIAATENVKLEGSFKAAGGAGAAGGNFSLDHKFHEDLNPETDPRLGNLRHVVAVKQSRAEAVVAEAGAVKAEVAADMLKEAGFGKAKLAAEDAIEFQGSVDLNLKRGLVLDAPEIAARDGAQAKLAAGLVTLQNTPAAYRPAGGYAGVATKTGTGKLEVTGDLVELAGHVTLNGFAETQLAARGDLRATGFAVALNTAPNESTIEETTRNLTGSLTTPGNLTLTAAQVYPATAIDYTIRVANVAADGTASNAPGRTLTIRGNDNTPSPVLSAGGKLRFEADRIVQDGVVKAPLGALEFVAASKLLVTDRSITSVAANGLTMPFGITADGESLFYGSHDRTATPPEKRILFEAPDEEVAPEAQIDISGGGELQAVEWVPGLGGSKDVLLADDTWAIVPGLRFASRDAMLDGMKNLGFDKAGAIYDSVYLAGGGALPAGYYALLPGYYALLPGAYVVTRPAAAAAMTSLQPGATALLASGHKVVAGRFASAASGETETGWSGFVVRNGSEVLREAEYRISDSSFYADAAKAAERAVPQLPADAGRVSFVATTALALGGVLKSLPKYGGRIGEVDIAAPNLAIVSRAGAAPANFVEIDAGRISDFNASVMLGGTRSSVADGTAVDVVASEVRVLNDADHAVTTPELILAAKDRVEVAAGAVLEAKGSSAASGKDLIVADADDDGGALLRLSAGAPVRVLRGAKRGANRGELEVAAGSVLRTSRSLLLDATTTTRSLGTLDIAAGGAASFAARKVSLGETPVDADGLVMDRTQLETLGALGELTLRSYTTLDLYGNAAFGNRDKGSLTIDAAGIVGHAVDGRNDATLAAQKLVLQNSGTATAAVAAGAGGTLALSGQSVTVGAGEKSISGYAATNVLAQGDLSVAGKGSLKVGGDLMLEAARITALGKSDQIIQAGDANIGWRDVVISRPADVAAITAQAAAGGHLAIIGKSIEQRGTIEMPSGVLELGARGSDAGDGVLLADGSMIVASGYARDFAGTTVAASGGTVTLSSDHGSVDMQVGASLDVSGTAGGDAGDLVVRAGEGEAHLNGTLAGGAAAGGESGSVTLDVGNLDNFSEVNDALKAGGFGNEFSVRARNGDVTIAATDTVTARKFDLVADQGSIDVSGAVDASGANGGGRIRLTAKNNLNLRAGSLLDARGTSAATGAADAYSHGGEVEVAAIDGRIDFADGATIDASAAAAGKSNGGKILFSAGRTVRGDGTPGVNMSLAGTVKVSGGGTPTAKTGSVVVEGRKTYTGVADTAAYVSPDISNPVWNDYQAFMNNAAAIRGDIALKNADGTAFDPAALRVRAGIELQSDGDMAHTAGWNLVQNDWRLGDEGGRLTLRAAGNLTISNTLGFPDDKLPTGETWSLSLVGGGDLASADALATVKSDSTGDVRLATTTARVTTGSGDIDIAAGRDFVIADIANTRAAVYTAGVPVMADNANGIGIGASLNRFAEGGGDVFVRALGNITGAAGAASPGVWLRRLTDKQITKATGEYLAQEGLWWVDRSKFTQGVGVFGSGNLSLTAKTGSVTNMIAAVATAGRDLDNIRSTVGGELKVYGGGNLNVVAGGDVVGGSYLLGRGNSSISTAGNFGAPAAATRLYVMGESDDEALRFARMKIETLGDTWLTSASNPTVLNLDGTGSGIGYGGKAATFFTYSPWSALSLISTAGDISPVAPGQSSGAMLSARQIYPTSVTVAALQGNVISSEEVSSSSTSQWAAFTPWNGSIQVFAAGNVTNQRISLADGLDYRNDLGITYLVPYWNNYYSITGDYTLGALTADSRTRAVLHVGDSDYHYKVVALDGDISGSKFSFPEKSLIQAGGDIGNLTLMAQNLAAEDVSIVRTGSDIGYSNFNGAGEEVGSNNYYIRIGGPGRLLVQAGGNIDFGQAAGVNAVGNADNRSLTTDKSAAVTVLAGVKDEVAQADLDALFDTLRTKGTARDVAASDAAIAALFGEPDSGSGDIRMVYSGIQTQGDSPIQVLAPHGRINVGLPTADAAKELGIITAAGGSIDVLVRDDILVNLSKIVTMLGGDLTIYAQQGGIDAGRGPRDSVSSLAPKVMAIKVINSKGQSVDSGLRRFQPPIDAAGSGMRTISYDPDGPMGPIAKPEPGAIYLFAPRGTIDAGEAGVNAAGNLVVVAQTVLNGSNFSAGGASSGVPVSDAGSLAGALSAASGSAASSSKGGEDMARASTGSKLTETFKPSFITVEVLGIGED